MAELMAEKLSTALLFFWVDDFTGATFDRASSSGHLRKQRQEAKTRRAVDSRLLLLLCHK
jgi:hypothetical protein